MQAMYEKIQNPFNNIELRLSPQMSVPPEPYPFCLMAYVPAPPPDPPPPPAAWYVESSDKIPKTIGV